MSTAQVDAFEQLQSKIQQLVEMYQKEKAANELLKKQRLELQEQLSFGEGLRKDLEDKYNKLKISKALIASSENVHDAKLKVNRMVREIDKCIALLNR